MNYSNLDLTSICSPINIPVFEDLLVKSEYDGEETQFLINGLKRGFSLEYQGNRKIQQMARNLPFRIGDKIDLWNKIMEEVKLNRFAGPFEDIPFDNYIQSPIGLVPKDGGKKMRLIFHLSYPKDGTTSVNHNTPYEKCRVTYKDFDQAIRRCLEELEQSGGDCYLGKSDLTSAFRILGIRPEDWFLLVMKAENPKDNKIYYFVDKCLPFGHALSCALFQRMSNAIEWVTRWKTGKEAINYLDDYFFADGIRRSCDLQLTVFLTVCTEINFPYSKEKTFWSTTQLVFLGLLIDTLMRMICIPIDKIEKAKVLIEKYLNRKSKKIKLLEIQQIAGFLNFLCKAVVPGRPFVRRLYFFCKSLKLPHHHTRITRDFRQDLEMWQNFLNHPSIYCRPFADFDKSVTAHQVNFFTDASRNFQLGAGGICDDEWFALKWDKNYMKMCQPSIEYLELYAVLVGVLNWIKKFANQRIIIFCDNISVVYMINRNTSSCKQCLTLIRILVLESMIYNVRISANYVSSKDNKLADLLSRRKFRQFRLLAPNMKKYGTPIPEKIWPMYKLWVEN